MRSGNETSGMGIGNETNGMRSGNETGFFSQQGEVVLRVLLPGRESTTVALPKK